MGMAETAHWVRKELAKIKQVPAWPASCKHFCRAGASHR